MSTTPDDGGSGSTHTIYVPDPNMPTRAHLAAQFAAAWVPVFGDANDTDTNHRIAYEMSNTLGLAQADDLLRRLKEQS